MKKGTRFWMLLFVAATLFPWGHGGADATGQASFSSDQGSESDDWSSFQMQDVVREARNLASRPYRDERVNLPEALASLDYDQYRKIDFRRDKAIWHDAGLPFQLHLFHTGYLYHEPVEIHVIEDGQVSTIPFSTGLFEYHLEGLKEIVSTDVGLAGFRANYRHPGQDKLDEVISFLGASYFRAIGRAQIYGVSARGIAIDTGVPKTEEFPAFRQLWIERPTRGQRKLYVYALMDGPSLAGAYDIEIQPGETTVLDVRAHLFFRKAVGKLGLSPLTSMFLFGETRDPRFRDRRPEVHDSDGLLIADAGDELLWRPLRNPHRVSVVRYEVRELRGFGLTQRDRDASHYRDLEAKYHFRPTVWVQPKETWRRGSIELVELPSNYEGYDNISAFWVPPQKAETGHELQIAYRLHFAGAPPIGPDVGKAMATHYTVDGKGVRFRVEFRGGRLDELGAHTVPEPVVTASRGQISSLIVEKASAGTWRLRFRLSGEDGEHADLRAFLRRGEETLTETWSYLWEFPQ